MVALFPQPCPKLPTFEALCVRGLYHASAPIHLLLSYATENPESRAILLTPSRESFRDALVEMNDQHLNNHSGEGRICAASQRIEIFYPPTLAHLRLMLSMLHEYDDRLHDTKMTLDTAPALLVLHEVSAYFAAQASEATVSAYLSVISSALALTSSWSPKSSTKSKFVVFDSGLGALKLPILRALSFGEAAEGESSRRDTLSILLERYMEWVVEFPEGPRPGSEEEDIEVERKTETRSLKLRRVNTEKLDTEASDGPGRESENVVCTWTESVEVDRDGMARTVFSWTDVNKA